MRRSRKTKKARELWLNVTAAALLIRRFAPDLFRHLVEQLDLERRLRRQRMSTRERRLRRSLKVGGFAVGVAAAGAVAKQGARLAKDRAGTDDR